MAQLSMNETTTFRWSFEEDVTHYTEAGIRAIGVWRRKLLDFGEEKGIEMLVETGMEVSQLLWAGGFTGSDGRSFRVSLQDAHEALATAAAMRAGCLVVYSGARAGHTHNHARRLIREALVELAPVAEEKDVILAVEPMHPACGTEFTFLNTLDDVLELIDAVGSPRVKLVFDTYHLGHDPDILERIPQIIPHLALVQLGDARHPPEGEQDRCRLGEGILPLREMIAQIRGAGYDGFFDVELLGQEIEMLDYHDLLVHARTAFDDFCP